MSPFQPEPIATGSVQLALNVGPHEVDSATAELSRPADPSFEPRIRTIDVAGEQGTLALFSRLPAGDGYAIVLSSDECTGSASFAVQANAVTPVDVTLRCESTTGGAGMSDAVVPEQAQAASEDCNLISSIVAGAPLAEEADTRIQLVLNEGVSALGVGWAVSPKSGKGFIRTSTETRLAVSFQCQASGTVEVGATVLARSGRRNCSDEDRIIIACDLPEP